MYFCCLFIISALVCKFILLQILALTDSSIVYPLTGDISNGYLSVSVEVGKDNQSKNGNVFPLLVVCLRDLDSCA